MNGGDAATSGEIVTGLIDLDLRWIVVTGVAITDVASSDTIEFERH